MRFRTILLLLVLAVSSPAVQRVALAQGGSASPAVRLEGGAAAHSGVDDLYARFSRGYDVLDARAVAGLYSEDALYLAPDSDILRGRAAVEATFSKFFEQVRKDGGKLAIRFRIVDRTVTPDMVCDVGYFDLTTTRDGKSQTGSGKFTLVARRQGTDWRIHVDGYSGVPQGQPAGS